MVKLAKAFRIREALTTAKPISDKEEVLRIATASSYTWGRDGKCVPGAELPRSAANSTLRCRHVRGIESLNEKARPPEPEGGERSSTVRMTRKDGLVPPGRFR